MTAHVVVLDIETYPTRVPELIEKVRRDAIVRAPANSVKKELKATWHSEEAREKRAREAWLKTSLDPLLAEILCVGVAFDDEAPNCHTAMWQGETEEEMLRAFADELRQKTAPSTVFVTFNGEGLDLPTLQNALCRWGVLPPDWFPRIHHSRVWGRSFDVMQHVPSKNGKGMVSASKAAGSYRLQDPKTKIALPDGRPMSGQLVREAFDLRAWAEISAYCAEDVGFTRELYNALTFDGQWGTWAADAALEEDISEIWKAQEIGRDHRGHIVLKVLAAAGKIPRWWAGLEGRPE